MERLPKRVYSPELRKKAVRRYKDEQLTIPGLAKRRLGNFILNNSKQLTPFEFTN